MDEILELIKVWGEAGASLLLGGAFAIMAVASYLKGKHVNFAAVVLWLSVGTELVAVGVLHLLNLILQEWIWVNFIMVLGILSFMEGSSTLFPTVAAGVRKWLAVVAGVVLILVAGFYALTLIGAFRD